MPHALTAPCALLVLTAYRVFNLCTQHYCTITIIKDIYEIVTDVTARCCAHYGQGSGSILIRYVSCAGSESRVTDCSYSTSSSSVHSNDVGVQCQPGNNAHF